MVNGTHFEESLSVSQLEISHLEHYGCGFDNINYAEHVVSLEKAIAAWKDPDMTAGEKNKILKSIISKIEYTGPKTGSEHAKRGVTPFTLEVFLRL